MLAAFPAQAQSEGPADLRMEGYFVGLTGLPLFAIRAAREKIIAGETNLDSRFAPTPPQFAVLARSMLAPLQRDLSDLHSIADRAEMPEPVASEQARIMKGFEKLHADIQAGR